MGVLKWNLVLTWFFGSNRMVSDIRNGQTVRMESLNHYIYVMIRSDLSLSHGFKHLFIVIGSSFCGDWTWKDEVLFQNLWWNCESIRFCDCCSDSRIFIFKIDDFLFWTSGTEYESWKYCDKVDKEDKLVENWTRGRWIPIDSVKSWNYFGNYGHKIGDMGYIDSDKTNPAH